MKHARRLGLAALILSLMALTALAEGGRPANSPAPPPVGGETQAIDESDLSTPRVGVAVVAADEETGTVPLYASLDGGPVVMEYFCGAPAQVTHVRDDGWAAVRVGDAAAGMDGYMRVEWLKYGPMAQRAVRPFVWDVSLAEEAPVYAQPDKSADVLREAVWGECMSVIGRNGAGWVQTAWLNGGETANGGMIEARHIVVESTHVQYGWGVTPLAGELDAQAIKQRVIEELVARGGALDVARDFTARRTLEAMTFDVRLVYSWAEREAVYVIYITDPQDSTRGIGVTMTPQGEWINAETAHG